MSNYVDGFVVPVPKDKLEAYREISEKSSAIWLEHGALQYVEAVGDDLSLDGTVSFLDLAGASEDETVVFAFITYESREERDRVNAAVMADPRMEGICTPETAPFDFRRMAYGGFRAIVQH